MVSNEAFRIRGPVSGGERIFRIYARAPNRDRPFESLRVLSQILSKVEGNGVEGEASYRAPNRKQELAPTGRETACRPLKRGADLFLPAAYFLYTDA